MMIVGELIQPKNRMNKKIKPFCSITPITQKIGTKKTSIPIIAKIWLVLYGFFTNRLLFISSLSFFLLRIIHTMNNTRVEIKTSHSSVAEIMGVGSIRNPHCAFI